MTDFDSIRDRAAGADDRISSLERRVLKVEAIAALEEVIEDTTPTDIASARTLASLGEHQEMLEDAESWRVKYNQAMNLLTELKPGMGKGQEDPVAAAQEIAEYVRCLLFDRREEIGQLEGSLRRTVEMLDDERARDETTPAMDSLATSPCTECGHVGLAIQRTFDSTLCGPCYNKRFSTPEGDDGAKPPYGLSNAQIDELHEQVDSLKKELAHTEKNRDNFRDAGLKTLGLLAEAGERADKAEKELEQAQGERRSIDMLFESLHADIGAAQAETKLAEARNEELQATIDRWTNEPMVRLEHAPTLLKVGAEWINPDQVTNVSELGVDPVVHIAGSPNLTIGGLTLEQVVLTLNREPVPEVVDGEEEARDGE